MSWSDIIKKRPADVPFYTALKGRACILVLLSSQTVRDPDVIEKVLTSNLPLALQVEAFLKGTYPILRCNFVFPDNPKDPLILESPLDVTDGNVQDFCNAIIGDETIDVILTHETSRDEIGACAVQASGLADMLKREVNRVLAELKPAATVQDFNDSMKTMEHVFPSGSAGVSAQKCARLKITGEARHKLVEY